MDDQLQQIYQCILDGDQKRTPQLVQQAMENNHRADIVLNQAMIAAMREVGRLFEEGEYFVPEMLIAARAMKEGLNVLKPYLQQESVQAAGKIVIGTVQGDLHDIGKNLVSMMLEGGGFTVIDLGTDVSPAKFVDAVRKEKPDILGMSALLTTTMPNMQKVIQALQAEGLRDQVKVIIGGAPVTDEYAARIGADGFAPSASHAVTLAEKIIQ